ncbi:exported hypothetical protein [Desulfamplus magnetovallimortis]|uniref:histidine kinase n=1 Tax=Desulfamplus magnetovallimortis TaxID=1246637 RepID=A0A1W1H7D7_9BACT|nr:transporter substrate-binding domain-containing protein [Desulfamplus magnetovallimortis]SLM28346.1 exported hypothetical protein [Desulfamplus magnetovallimortis]
MKFKVLNLILSVCIICIVFICSGSGLCVEYPDTLTDDEVKWLESMSDKPIHYLVPPKFAPVSFIEDGAVQGIVKEYLGIIEEFLGVRFELVDVPWKQGLELARQGEMDLFPCIARSSEREEYLEFLSGSYLSFPLVIVTRKDVEGVREIDDLANRRVAVDKRLVAYSKLSNEHSYLNIEYVFVEGNVNAMRAVYLNEADVALTSSAVAGYTIVQNGWNNLQIAGETGWPEVELTMGVRKDWPQLVSILEKTIAVIPESTRTSVNNKWIPVHFEHSFDSVYVLKRILPFLAGILAVTLGVSFFLFIVMKKNRQLREADEKIQSAYKELEHAWKIARDAYRAKSEFLDNSGQAFLSFGEDFLVDLEYSRECEVVFGQPVGGKDIRELLFSDKETCAKETFQRAITLLLNETLDLKQDIYLSLLKKSYTVKGHFINADYKLISDNKIMLILTDVTRERLLEQDVKNERCRLKFVITAVRENKDFFDIIDDFNQFKFKTLPELASPFKEITPDKEKPSDLNSSKREILSQIYRSVHTFKGVFAQQEFITFPGWLHGMESRIAEILSVETLNPGLIEQFVTDFGAENALEKDLDIIKDVLGESFMERKGSVLISPELALGIERISRKLLEGFVYSDSHGRTAKNSGKSIQGIYEEESGKKEQLMVMLKEIRSLSLEFADMLKQATEIRYVDIKSLLEFHVDGAMRLSRRLGKQIAPFEVEGDEIKIDPDVFAHFIRSLVNIFRNCVDHGIETPEERVELGKPELAKLSCSVRKLNGADNSFELSISDDGRGIDIDAVKKKAFENGFISSQSQIEDASDDEILNLVFESGFTTCSNVTAMSGRGMGLSAVREELEKIDGKVEIKSRNGEGTEFLFHIPL